jgi:hypothetical protein
MDPEIERLVYQMRKEVYRDLEKGKEIMPRGWFFVNGKLGAVEIAIPFVERFFDSPQTKDLLSSYVAKKWAEYKWKGSYSLLAVVIMSDQWVTMRSTEGMSDEEVNEMIERSGPPRNDKNKMEFITFMVFMVDVKKAYLFRYIREKGRIRWAEEMEDIELADFGRFKDMYPKQVEAPQSNV